MWSSAQNPGWLMISPGVILANYVHIGDHHNQQV